MRILVITAVLSAALTYAADDRADLKLVDQVKAEAFDRSQVMDHLYFLTEVHGPRLTGSPQFARAAAWAVDRLTSFGLQNVHTEKWGPFGRAWSVDQASVELVRPNYQPLTAAPLAWSGSSNGPVEGEPIFAPVSIKFSMGPKKVRQQLDDYQKQWTGKLRGRIVLTTELSIPKPQTNGHLRRYTDADLAQMASAPDPVVKSRAKTLDELEWPEDPADRGKLFASLPNDLMEQVYDLYDELAATLGEFYSREGAAAVLQTDGRSHEGMVFAEAAGGFKSARRLAPPTFAVTAEQYDRLVRSVQRKQPVTLRINLKVTVSDQDVDGLNIIGEIPGGSRKDEVVMIGAHFDSWHTGTGTTDNGAGSAVMIEVMRVLKALNVKLDRTVRIGLWGGEEQGLFGSRAYVKEHYPVGSKANLSGYLNLDNGSGKIRGVYLQGHEAMRPVFEQWLAPFRDLGVTTISIRDTGGTDHLSFNAVGLPGFQFIQDPLDYGSVTHHSHLDVYDHAIPEDLMQASAVIAHCVIQMANRPDMLPRR